MLVGVIILSVLIFLVLRYVSLKKEYDADYSTFTLAGTHHVNDYKKIIQKLHEGQEVKLVPEPENQYDSHAMRAETVGGQKLGYVPRELNLEVLQIQDQGVIESCKISQVYEVKTEYPKIDVTLKLPKNFFDTHKAKKRVIMRGNNNEYLGAAGLE